MAGALPVICSRATLASRSQLEAGKTMTADFTLEPRHGPPASGAKRVRAIHFHARFWKNSTLQLNLVLLDDRVGQKLLAHGLELGLGLGGIVFRQFQVNHLALAHLADRGKAQAVQGMADGLALRIENTILESDKDARFHLPFGLTLRQAQGEDYCCSSCWSHYAVANDCRSMRMVDLLDQHRSLVLALHRFGHDSQALCD